MSTMSIGIDRLRQVHPHNPSGAAAIEHGYGHTELGARTHSIDGQAMPHNPALAAGVNLNDLGFADITRGDTAKNVWIDWVSGATVRQGLPARVEKCK